MRPWSGTDRFWDVATKFAVPLALSACGMLLNHESRLARVEETRFTSQDAAQMENRILRYMETDGPRWLKDYLDRVTAEMSGVRHELGAIKERLRKLEAK